MVGYITVILKAYTLKWCSDKTYRVYTIVLFVKQEGIRRTPPYTTHCSQSLISLKIFPLELVEKCFKTDYISNQSSNSYDNLYSSLGSGLYHILQMKDKSVCELNCSLIYTNHDYNTFLTL